MFGFVVIILVILFVIVILSSILLVVLAEWSNKADKELDMVACNIEDYEKRIRALERITFDIETEIRKEVYSQINKRELERMAFKCNSNSLYGKQVQSNNNN